MKIVRLKENEHLSQCDPLYSVLIREVFKPKIHQLDPEFELHCLNHRQDIYLGHELKSDIFFVCKFYGFRDHISFDKQRKLLNKEFNNLCKIRQYGFDHFPFQVIRPIGKNENINCVLIEEYAPGNDLDYYIYRAAHLQQNDDLLKKLEELACFFNKLHSLSNKKHTPNAAGLYKFFNQLLIQLSGAGIMTELFKKSFILYLQDWFKKTEAWPQTAVLVHGDATPTNFIFDPRYGLTAIDLECMQYADRVYDLGLITAELKHHFALRILQADAAEPFIQHFLEFYSHECQEDEFIRLTFRNRLYMALGELRIACNDWLPTEHRKWLAEEAFRCLS